MITQIAYISKRSPGLSDAHIVDGLILPATRKNRELDITGCIWFSNTHFFQVIEGPDETMRNLMKRIAADRRHHAMNVLLDRACDDRSFERWSLRLFGQGVPQPLGRLLASGLPQPEPKRGGVQAQLRNLTEQISGVISDLAAWPVTPSR